MTIHGWDGYPEEGWRPWLRTELKKKGIEMVNPAMPNTKNPKMDEWVDHLNKVIGKPSENIILIGHSLGCITILRYLEKIEKKIGGAIFVAGFSNDLVYKGYNKELSSFFRTPLNWNKIKENSKNFKILHSKDDPWVPIENAYELEKKLGVKATIQNGMKHYSGDDGLTELPTVLRLIEEL